MAYAEYSTPRAPRGRFGLSDNSKDPGAGRSCDRRGRPARRPAVLIVLISLYVPYAGPAMATISPVPFLLLLVRRGWRVAIESADRRLSAGRLSHRAVQRLCRGHAVPARRVARHRSAPRLAGEPHDLRRCGVPLGVRRARRDGLVAGGPVLALRDRAWPLAHPAPGRERVRRPASARRLRRLPGINCSRTSTTSSPGSCATGFIFCRSWPGRCCWSRRRRST